MNVAVFGLWHLGCVTAGCVAAAGNRVVGLDPDAAVVDDLRRGVPPVGEPGLADLLAAESAAGRLSFTTDAALALSAADVLWVTFDTPVNDLDEADVAFVRRRLDAVLDRVGPETIVLISSQVPVGFCRSLREGRPRLRIACSPENLRLGKAIDVFRHPERVVVGVADEAEKSTLAALFTPFSSRIEWMSLESAEMTKHAVNAFLATSVTFANELARLCEAVGADAKEVERGLKTEGRIGPKAYLSPGGAFAGGTLARDLRFLSDIGRRAGEKTPMIDGVIAGNERHKRWTQDKVERLLDGVADPVVAVLGLTYKPGTDTLRRSASVELCRWMGGRGWRVRAHDPAVRELPIELRDAMALCATPADALAGADLAVVATEWPEFRGLAPDDFLGPMRRPVVIDPNWHLAGKLGEDRRVRYVTTGRDRMACEHA